MNNGSLLGQVLGGVFGQAMSRRGMGGIGGMSGGMGGGLGGLGGIGMGSVLGGMLGGGRRGGLGGNRSALLLMLLPLAMHWVQRNGGVGAVLDRFKQKGYDRHAKSWVDTGENESLDDKAVEDVVGRDDLRQMAQKLGVPEQDVALAFAEIMPQMVDKLSPGGRVPPEADDVLHEGRQTLEREIEDVHHRDIPAGSRA